MSVVNTKENLDFAHKHHDKKLFVLNIHNEIFGLLYLTPLYYTIAWKGNLNFTTLDKSRLDVQNIIDNYSIRTIPNLATIATLIISDDVNNDELNRYHLEKEQHQLMYEDSLKYPQRIVFARYDVIKPPVIQPEIKYSFTAENESISTDNNELTIKLPKFLPGSIRLFEWIIKYHSKINIFSYIIEQETIRREQLAKDLAEMVNHLIIYS